MSKCNDLVSFFKVICFDRAKLKLHKTENGLSLVDKRMARAFYTLMQYGSLWNYVLWCFSHGMKSLGVQSFYQSIYPTQGHTREIRCVQINSVFSVPASPWGLIFPPIRGDYSPSLSPSPSFTFPCIPRPPMLLRFNHWSCWESNVYDSNYFSALG